MLSWTKGPDGWYSNGFRIELAEPFRWLLVEVDHQKAQVRIEQQPLAVARSLTECKREAELLAAARQRAELRRKHSVTFVTILALFVLLIGSTTDPLVLFSVVFLALRSLFVLLGTLLPAGFGEQHEVFYQ